MALDLQALATRCESATADEQREMLERAFYAIYPAPAVGSGRHTGWAVRLARFRAMLSVGSWESAALMLVSEGMDWRLGRTNDGLTVHAEVGGSTEEHMRFGDTPALALCAAALRATARMTGDEG